MISFSFDVDPSELQPPSQGFALGDMEVRGTAGVTSSRGRTPDQSMMIFVAVSDLLDGLHSLGTGRTRHFHFVGSDSSFQLDFDLGEDGRITTRDDGGADIDRSPAHEVYAAAYAAAASFLAAHRAQLPDQDPARTDLETSLTRFAAFRKGVA